MCQMKYRVFVDEMPHLEIILHHKISNANRPNRIVETQSIVEFNGNWISGQDSFQADVPAALVILGG
jgi:hypothetical protein